MKLTQLQLLALCLSTSIFPAFGASNFKNSYSNKGMLDSESVREHRIKKEIQETAALRTKLRSSKHCGDISNEDTRNELFRMMNGNDLKIFVGKNIIYDGKPFIITSCKPSLSTAYGPIPGGTQPDTTLSHGTKGKGTYMLKRCTMFEVTAERNESSTKKEVVIANFGTLARYPDFFPVSVATIKYDVVTTQDGITRAVVATTRLLIDRLIKIICCSQQK